MKTNRLIRLIATIGIIVFFAGVFMTIEHQANGMIVQFIGIGIFICTMGPALISKSYDFLVRRKGGLSRNES